jgi:hypothetical protein
VLVTSQGREILVGVSPAGVSIAQVTTVPTATADRDADDTAEAARLARSYSSPEGDR